MSQGRLRILPLVGLLCISTVACEPTPELDIPTTSSGKAGTLVRTWWTEGIAAGNAGDRYDNRDRGHSDLDLTSWPQVRRVRHSIAERFAGHDFGLQTALVPGVVFGNSSTAEVPENGGSNPSYFYLTWKGGLDFLHEQYRGNNLYVYPEYRDHDPGHNGKSGGYGDLFATNTPYLIISQGASRSDQPFLRVLPHVLAAFRPDVKRALIANGMLMPTLQWLLRTSQRNTTQPGAYFTGKSHPTAFEGKDVDEVAMIEKAHAFIEDAYPPLVQLRVLEEKFARPDVDYFDPGQTEQLADTPSVVARILRGAAKAHRIVISTEQSFDVNSRPLTFRWVVLRGNETEISIKPMNEQGTVAELIVDWQPRQPIAPGSALESNRVDIGIFASNGVYDSPPAFVTFLSLDNERRTYDYAGRILEREFHTKNFTDPRLTAPKSWRDVYHYDARGRVLGWTRHQRDGDFEFNAEGHLVLERDSLGRTVKARTVRYEQDAHAGNGANPNPLRFVPDTQLLIYSFANDDDAAGFVSSKRAIEANESEWWATTNWGAQ